MTRARVPGGAAAKSSERRLAIQGWRSASRRALEAEVRKLTLENDILQMAAACFARDQNPRLTRLRQPRSVQGDREGRIGSSMVSVQSMVQSLDVLEPQATTKCCQQFRYTSGANPNRIWSLAMLKG
jgi:hypothetical protein